jgi:uncharacterized membrane protein
LQRDVRRTAAGTEEKLIVAGTVEKVDTGQADDLLQGQADDFQLDHEHGPGGHHHHKVHPIDITTGTCFVGFIVILMTSLFMVNNSDPDISSAAFHMISQTASIFSAVLGYKILCMWLDHFLDTAMSECFARLILLVALILVVFVDVAELEDKESLAAVATMGGHLIGYAALELFGSIQRMRPFCLHPGPATVTLSIFFYVCMKVTQAIAGTTITRAVDDEKDAEFKMKIFKECEDDAFCFAVGFLFSQCAKMDVLGYFPPIHGNPKGHTQHDVNRLIVWTCLFLLGSMSLTPLQTVAGKRRYANAARFIFILAHTTYMAAAWMLVFTGEWQWFLLVHNESTSSGIMVMTFNITMIGFGLIFVLDFCADHVEMFPPESFRSVIVVIATAVGLTWEKAFHEAEHSISSLSEAPKRSRTLMVGFILSIVVPAWRYHILPNAMAHHLACVEESEESAEEEEKPGARKD